MERIAGVLGLIVFILIAWAFSDSKKNVSLKIILWGIGLQLALALAVLGVPALGFYGPLRPVFDALNTGIVQLLNFTLEGSRFIFGDLVDSEKSGFIFAFQVLPTIIFMGSLMAVLYHWGLMQKVVKLMAFVMQRTLKTSGAESLAVAANVFVGQTEAPLVIKPYIPNMTKSELLSLMTGGMATVAGGVLAAYVGLLRDRLPDIAGHLLTASLMSAPAALLLAKILTPETETPQTLTRVPQQKDTERYTNTIDAAAKGAGDGLKLALNVAAMLLAFIALLALVNACLSSVSEWIFNTPLTLQTLLGWFLAPIAWLMGVPWEEARVSGALIGEKIVLNEFVAYLHLSELKESLSERTLIIMSYALCGFANFSSIAIQIGGIGELAPNTKAQLAKLGLRAVLGGSLAAFMTAAIAGLLI